MRFPGDSEGVPVPVEAVAAARKQGAELVRTGMYGRMTPRSVAQTALDQLGTAGGIAGGAVGGIVGGGAAAAFPPTAAGAPVAAGAGRVAGGALGGGLGKAAQEVGYRALGLGDAPGTVQGEMAAQGMMGLGGEGLGLLSHGTGRALVRTGLPMKVASASQAVGEMVRKRIPVGGLGKSKALGPLRKGSEKAVENWRGTTKARRSALAQVDAQGLTIPRQVAEDAIQEMIDAGSRDMVDEAEVRFLQKRLASWQRRKGAFIPTSEIQSIVTRFNAKATPVHNALKRGSGLPTDAMQAKAVYHKQVADRLTDALEEAVPGYTELNKRVSNSIAAKNATLAAEHAGLRSLGSRFATGAAITGGAEALAGERNPHKIGSSSALAGAALASPALLSRTGLALTDPYLMFLLRNAPRFLPSE